MKVTTETKYGGQALSDKNPVARDGFKISAEAEVSEAQRNTLASIGLASVLYRAGGNVCTKALGVKTPSEAEFSDKAAATLTVALGKMADDGAVKELGSFALETLISRHTHGESKTPAFKNEREVLARHESADDLEEWLAKTTLPGGQFAPATGVAVPAYTGPTHGDDGEFHPDALRNAKVKIDSVRATF